MNYNHTIKASFTAFIVQAIVNNFVSLLLLMFQSKLGLTLAQVTSLVTINFAVQLLTDLICTKCIDKIGYRAGMVMAHFCAATGLSGLAFFPFIMSDAYSGILISVVVYAIGGGLLEVLASPVVEACPSDNKEKTMSMLHSFYCWGHVGVVLVSTLFFAVFGIEKWRILAVLWAIVPFVNAFVFMKVPIAPLLDDDETSMKISELFKNKMFWILMLLMMCAGASEQAISQWASAYAERGLEVNKTIGDLTGPMFFAVLMGTSRLLYGKFGEKINLIKFILFSILLCIAAYLMTALSGMPFLNLLGCGICGFSVGILWPGTFSLAASALRRGGTALFALLALAGDVGCSTGPTFVGLISDSLDGELSYGILAATAFPIVFLVGILLYNKTGSKNIVTENKM